MLDLSRSKQTAYKIAYKRMASIEDIPVSSLTIEKLQDVVDAETSTFYPARDMKNVFSHLYKRAMAQQEVGVNLSEFIRLPELEEDEPVPFNEEELKKLWADYGAGHRTTGYILLMIYSGMMPGELVKADKSMIDWEKQQFLGCGLKTDKRKEIPIGIINFMLPVLQDLCALSTKEKLLCMNRWYFYDDFHEVMARCGIADRTPYACRHTTATALALAGVPEEDIKVIMRHAKVETTRKYIHKEFDISPFLEVMNQSFKEIKNGTVTSL